MEAKLVVVGGKANMGEVKLRLPMTIGRGRKADLIISHPTVSRIHCELTEVDGALVVRDNSSSNGTFIDDVQVKQSIVEPGQILKIGPLSFRADYKWSGSKPELTTKENPGLAATQTMTYEELMGEDASVATTPPKKPDVKAKPAAKESKKPDAAKGKPAPAAPKNAPPAPEPVVNKSSAATVDDDEFDFGKEIEFVDDAPVEESITQQAPPKTPAAPAKGKDPVAKAPASKTPVPKPAAADTIVEETDAAGREANFDFLDDLGLDAPSATAHTVEDRAVEPPAKSPAPAAAPATDEPEFDFLADLGSPSAGADSSPVATGDESSGLIEPPAESFRRPTPTETVDYEFLRGLNGPDDDESPAAEMPAVDEAAAETSAVELPNDEDIDLDHFLADESLAEPQAGAAAEPQFDVAPPEPEVAPSAEAAAESEAVAEFDANETWEAPAAEAAPEVPSFPVEAAPKEADDVGFDFLAELESEPAPAAEETPPAAATSGPAIDPSAAEEAMFDDFLADVPEAAAEPTAPQEPVIAATDTAAAAEVAAAPAEDPWSFDVEQEPAAEVTVPFVDAIKPTSETAPTMGPPPVDEAAAAESVTESQPTGDDGFDFLADIAPTATEPAPEADAKHDAIDATIDFRSGDIDELAEAPAFSFAPEDAAPAATAPTESPFAVDEPAPVAAEAITAEPAVAPVAAAPRAPAAKKLSFLDKLKLLFSGSAKKKAGPPKAKGPAPKIGAEPKLPGESEAAPPFAAAPFAPRQSDAPIPLSDEPLNVGTDEAVAPAAEAAPPAPAEEFAFDEFLSDAPAATAEAPAAETIDVPQPVVEAQIPEAPVVEEPIAASKEEPELFDFLADVPAAAATEAPVVQPETEGIPLADAPAAEEVPLEPSMPASPAWASESGIPLDDFVAEAPAATEPPPAPEAAAPAVNTEDDFASFLEDMAPAAAAEAPQTITEPEAASEPAAELPPLDDASDVDQAEADLAHELFGFEPEPTAETPPSDAPAAEAPQPELAAFDDFLPAGDSLASPVPTATDAEPVPESSDDAFSFAAETEEAAAPGIEIDNSEREFAVEAEPMTAEAAPTMSPSAAPPTSTPNRVRSIDVDTRLTASHRTLARVTIRNPRIEVPHMEPDVPAGRTFNRTGRKAATVESATPAIPAPAPLSEASMESPAVVAASAMALGDMTMEPPPIAPPDDSGDMPPEFGFLDDEPAAAAATESPAPETPAVELFAAEVAEAPIPKAEEPNDDFNFFDDMAAESAATVEDKGTSAEPSVATPDTNEAIDLSFLPDEPVAPEAEAAAPEVGTAEPEFDFDAFLDEGPSAPAKEASPPPKKSDDKELDDFLSDLGMG